VYPNHTRAINNCPLFLHSIFILTGFALAIFNKDGGLLAGMTLFLVTMMVIQYIKIPEPKTVLSFVKFRIGLILLVLIMLGVTIATPFLKSNRLYVNRSG
jgi:hypothetical protein